MGANPLVLTVSANSPFKSLADLVQYAKKNPGKLNVPQRGQLKQEFARRIQQDIAMWRPMMAKAGIVPE